MRKFTKIQGLSQVRRLPRLGKIRLGIKVKNAAGVEYPKETEYFVVPEEVSKIHGARPTELDVMIPVEDETVSFPQNYAYYGSSKGLKCSGDGETALRSLVFHKEYNKEPTQGIDSRELIEVPCTCELFDQKKCKQQGYLQVLLPKVSVGGVYQLVTSSYNSIVDINSGIDYVRAMIGRIAMVPLKLKREPRETHFDGKKQIHYTLRLELEGDVMFINQLRENTTKILSGPSYALPPPVQENPELEPVDTVETEAEPNHPEEPAAQAPVEAPSPPPQAPDAPAASRSGFTKEELLKKLSETTDIEVVNQVINQSRGLMSTARNEVKIWASKRVKEISEGNKKVANPPSP